MKYCWQTLGLGHRLGWPRHELDQPLRGQASCAIGLQTNTVSHPILNGFKHRSRVSNLTRLLLFPTYSHSFAVEQYDIRTPNGFKFSLDLNWFWLQVHSPSLYLAPLMASSECQMSMGSHPILNGFIYDFGVSNSTRSNIHSHSSGAELIQFSLSSLAFSISRSPIRLRVVWPLGYLTRRLGGLHSEGAKTKILSIKLVRYKNM